MVFHLLATSNLDQHFDVLAGASAAPINRRAQTAARSISMCEGMLRHDILPIIFLVTRVVALCVVKSQVVHQCLDALNLTMWKRRFSLIPHTRECTLLALAKPSKKQNGAQSNLVWDDMASFHD
jgi:hypothetical protein